jgi:hypothetical protein
MLEQGGVSVLRTGLMVATAVLIVLTVCLPVQAQGNPAPGRTISLVCAHDRNQRYVCYLPSKYAPGKKWPILYCFSPSANGMSIVNLYRNVCEKNGWIAVGSNNARNGPGGPIATAIEAMWKDTHSRFKIDDGLCYSTGFSGGGTMAFTMAQKYSDHFAGVIPMATGNWMGYNFSLRREISVYYIVGSNDGAEAVKSQAQALKSRGHKTEVKVFPGGHVLPPVSVCEDAVCWQVQQAPVKKEKCSSAEAPGSRLSTELKLEKTVTKRLRTAARKAERGDLGAALRLAEKVLNDKNAQDKDKASAQYVKAEVEGRIKRLLGKVDKLLGENMPYEALELLKKLRKAAKGTDVSKTARKRVKEIESDKSLKDDLSAGKLLARAREYISKGSEKTAQKLLKQIADKYPDTRYAELAKAEK